MPSYVATSPHRSEYPEPIRFARGEHLAIGEKYEGPEGRDLWYLCSLPARPGQPGGWVPAQVIDWSGRRSLEDYTARELDVGPDDVLHGGKSLNGWIWCIRPADGLSGWVPQRVLREAGAGPLPLA